MIRDCDGVCPMLAFEMQNSGDITHEEVEEYRSEERYSRGMGTILCSSAAMFLHNGDSIHSDRPTADGRPRKPSSPSPGALL